MTKRQKVAVTLNALIFATTVFATVSMIVGFYFMSDVKFLSESNFHAFKFFTVDSNVFAGLVALAYLIYRFSPAGKKSTKLPRVLYVLKLAATTGVTLTMMVTVFFLAPGSTTTYFAYFMNSNFFMHLVTPLLCIISFVFFEPTGKTPLAISLTGIIPTILYAAFYIPNIFMHLDNGYVSPTYDWYGFLAGGLNTSWLVIPIMFILTWIFAVVLWALNRKFSGNKTR